MNGVILCMTCGGDASQGKMKRVQQPLLDLLQTCYANQMTNNCPDACVHILSLFHAGSLLRAAGCWMCAAGTTAACKAALLYTGIGCCLLSWQNPALLVIRIYFIMYGMVSSSSINYCMFCICLRAVGARSEGVEGSQGSAGESQRQVR